MTSNPTPIPAATPNFALDPQSLLDELAKLQQRLDALKQKGGCFADLNSQIIEGRSMVLTGRFPEALALNSKVSAAIERAEASVRAEPLAWKLLWIEVSYLTVILALGYFVMRYPNYWLWSGLVGLSAKAAWFGAIGGVTIGLYGIYTHISAKDFDANFRLWYLCKPVMGAIFGWFVVLIYYVGLVSTQGASPQVNSPQVPYAIAFLAGFSERFTTKTIDRLMTVLTGGDDKKKDKAAKDKPDGLLPTP